MKWGPRRHPARVTWDGDVSACRGWSDASRSRCGVTAEKRLVGFASPEGYLTVHSYRPPTRATRRLIRAGVEVGGVRVLLGWGRRDRVRVRGVLG